MDGLALSAFCGIVRLDGGPASLEEAAAMAAGFAAPPRSRPDVWGRGGKAFGGVSLPLTPEDRLPRQPRVAGGGRFDLLFAGRLDNRADLAAALGIGAGELAGLADGTLAIRAFERWGEAGFGRLSGAWTLAVWDGAERRLVLARDPMGGRSLFYHRQGGQITFASSIAALLRLARVGRGLDEAVLGDMLMLTLGERDRTFYAEISRVPGGHRVVIGPGGLEITAFWQPPDTLLRLAHDDDYVQAGRELLDRAVAASLRSAGPVAVLGSGGLDSAGVSATAARLLAPGRLRHYARVPPAQWQGPSHPNLYPDERPKLRALAALHPNIQLVEIDEAALHPVDRDPRCLFLRYGVATLVADNLGWMAQATDQARADGHRVLLTGDFGNNGLSANGRGAAWELLRHRRWGALSRELRGWKRRQGWSWATTLRQTLLGRMAPDWVWHLRRRLRASSYPVWSLINPDFVRAAGLERRAKALGIAFGPQSRDPALMRAVIIGWSGRLQGDLLSQTVAVDGFEARAPLADLALIEFTLRIPPTQFCREGVMRWLARRVLADRLPPEITAEEAAGAQNPEWFGRHSLTLAEARAELPRLAASPLASRILDLPRAARLLDSWPQDAEAAMGDEGAYRLAISRGLHMARFIRWNEGGNG